MQRHCTITAPGNLDHMPTPKSVEQLGTREALYVAAGQWHTVVIMRDVLEAREAEAYQSAKIS